jgi:hypothetical protein
MRLALEAISLTSVLTAFAMVKAFWTELPDRVPSHFGFSGQADAWSSKETMWLVPIVLAALYLLLSLTQRFPRMINIPFDIDRTDPEVRGLLALMMLWLKALMSLTFLWIVWSQIETALGRATGLGLVFLPFSLGGTTVVTVFFLKRLRRYRR